MRSSKSHLAPTIISLHSSGMSREQIAKRLEISKTTVSRYLHLANLGRTRIPGSSRISNTDVMDRKLSEAIKPEDIELLKKTLQVGDTVTYTGFEIDPMSKRSEKSKRSLKTV